ncbi:histidine--tRNA ligase [Sulfuriroseicoccus oceanibius]|uniref:Histidine--tRNA ligase n=1 Tax=Sulfuriroseicoccus oceanibius TaxID=2707525 RepID=A0A6B3L908_9BACT|nr:histidine--tRNA ligase [Sulfuriroseicoccus oceanibius]QQL44864.1 histidine--tRNA ligase [Sulfuriroseicoccus oceanibius]
MAVIKTLPGFNDFFPEDLRVRTYLFDTWRNVAHRYGFVEYEAPMLESTDLYRKKSGNEIVSQLFNFTDQGGRDLALRPELTPSLARMAAARQRDYRKPMKWFEIGQCFRSEKPQKGRWREFIQFNCDIIGTDSPAADAELIALNVDLMRDLGFTAEDVKLRLSNRKAWDLFLSSREIPADKTGEFLSALDKLERDREGTAKKLEALGIDVADVEGFIADPSQAAEIFDPITNDLEARGMMDFIEIDLSIVRGLAYYTGTVFELFDRAGKMRAVAGGGRYDELLALVSDGACDLPAVGFAMGNAVILDLIRETAEPLAQMETWLAAQSAADVFVVIADESQRAAAVQSVQQLRAAGIKVDYPLAPLKFGKQFQAADAVGAKLTVIIGSEFPELGVKNIATREETKATADELVPVVRELLATEPATPQLA